VIGTTIGNFEVTRALGHGGMGQVWLAQHKDIKTRVAIKTLLPHISADKQQVQRFFNEAVAVSKIKHAGITKIFDVGFLPTGEAYLIMEFLEGESLAARIARIARLRLRELADITRQIAGVLEATHAEGITHRDLKPDNLYLVADAELARGERVKVLDFGIAKLASGPGMTGSGTLGTPLYMSPEQWKTPGAVDGRADIYSLGCIVCQMATGTPPFVASSMGEACTLHLTEPVPSLRARVASLPARIDEIVVRMLAKAKDARPGLREIRTAFSEIEAEAAAQAPAIVAFVSTMPDGSPSGATAATAASGAAEPALGSTEAVSPASPSAPTVATGAGVAAVSNTTLGNSASVINKPAAQPARPWWAIAAGVMIVVGAMFGWNTMRGNTSHDAAPTPSSASAQPLPTPAVTSQPAHQAAADAPMPVATSHVHIAGTPASAKIRIDKDDVIGAPFDRDFPRDATPHSITIMAPGYRPHAETVTFADNLNLAYGLTPDAPVRREDPRPPANAAATYTGAKSPLITRDPANQ
jgi:serine/threonine protein kinase